MGTSCTEVINSRWRFVRLSQTIYECFLFFFLSLKVEMKFWSERYTVYRVIFTLCNFRPFILRKVSPHLGFAQTQLFKKKKMIWDIGISLVLNLLKLQLYTSLHCPTKYALFTCNLFVMKKKCSEYNLDNVKIAHMSCKDFLWISPEKSLFLLMHVW